MKILWAAIYAALAVLLSMPVADAQEGALACSPVQAQNNPGDGIHGDFCVTNFGRHDVGFRAFSSGGDAFSWSGPDHDCWHWTVTANTFNETFWAQWEGDGSGWQAYCAVTQVDRIGGGRREVLRRGDKDQLHAIGTGMVRTSELVGVGIPLCPWTGCQITLGVLAVGLLEIGEQLKAVDPFDPLYGTLYDASIPEPSALGLDWDYSGDGNAETTNYFLWRVVRFRAYGEAANISVNRANSCPESDTSCINAQTDRAQYYFRLLGETAYDASYFLDQLGDAFGGYWNPDLGGTDLVSALHDGASQMRDAYGTLYGINY